MEILILIPIFASFRISWNGTVQMHVAELSLSTLSLCRWWYGLSFWKLWGRFLLLLMLLLFNKTRVTVCLLTAIAEWWKPVCCVKWCRVVHWWRKSAAAARIFSTVCIHTVNSISCLRQLHATASQRCCRCRIGKCTECDESDGSHR